MAVDDQRDDAVFHHFVQGFAYGGAPVDGSHIPRHHFLDFNFRLVL
jgi:hypothetical protein